MIARPQLFWQKNRWRWSEPLASYVIVVSTEPHGDQQTPNLRQEPMSDANQRVLGKPHIAFFLFLSRY